MDALLGCCTGAERRPASAPTGGAGGLSPAAAVVRDEGSDAAQAELMKLWGSLLLHRRPCDAQDMPTRYEELGSLLGSYDDLHPGAGRRKRISGQGAVCLARVHWRESKYTGLFERSDNCLLRLSSALPTNLSDPTAPIMPRAPGSLRDTVLVPFVALKVFRAGFGSGNLLFGGRKTGQSEPDYFEHCLSTHLTERASVALWPVMKVFRRYSEYPMQAGLSDFAAVGQDGAAASECRFPWALMLCPSSPEARGVGGGAARNFLQQLSALRPGTTLYHVYACDSPGAAVAGPLHHAGDVVTTSGFVESGLEAHLRFRHQLKEEDYALRPDWLPQLTGAHRNYGWEHFAGLPREPAGRWLPHAAWLECAGDRRRLLDDAAARSAPGGGAESERSVASGDPSGRKRPRPRALAACLTLVLVVLPVVAASLATTCTRDETVSTAS